MNLCLVILIIYKPYLGKGINGKLRWLMVIQALRFSSNSLMNSAINNDEYIVHMIVYVIKKIIKY